MSYIYKPGRRELYEQIKNYAGVVRGRVLDVGSSSFPRYKNLFDFTEYVTMDVAPGADVEGSAEAIPFPDASFDAIVCTQVLGDVYDLRAAFREFYRVITPGGVALITENLYDSLHGEPHDYWRFTEHSFRRLAEDAGFAIETLERRGGYHSVIAQMRARYWIERLAAHRRWFARPMSITLRILGAWARLRDRHDTSRANKLFTHGYLLIVRKNRETSLHS
ncbi:MAG: methyltransferase domain-containing protein [Candidatus Pacebacteria bacterium]|nr:methyltransferase domain-containing protein [Candidatus Paceibacterota bacterium]